MHKRISPLRLPEVSRDYRGSSVARFFGLGDTVRRRQADRGVSGDALLIRGNGLGRLAVASQPGDAKTGKNTSSEKQENANVRVVFLPVIAVGAGTAASSIGLIGKRVANPYGYANR